MAPTRPVKMDSNGKRDMAHRMTLAFKRAEAIGFDWTKVSQVELLTALTTALQAGAALMFSPASGGKGVCLKVFEGDTKAVEYASLPEEMNNMLSQVVDHYQSSAEDARLITTKGLEWRAAAD